MENKGEKMRPTWKPLAGNSAALSSEASLQELVGESSLDVEISLLLMLFPSREIVDAPFFAFLNFSTSSLFSFAKL